VFTFLREPVDRVISLYHFYKQQTRQPATDPRVAVVQSTEFADFVAQVEHRLSPWCNWQTFIFSGASDCEGDARELLPQAQRNLDRLDFVGIQDDLLRGVEFLAEMHGWHVALPRDRVNKGTHRPPARDIPASAIQRLAELNECDARLFAHARERWEGVLASRRRPTVRAAQPDPVAMRQTESSRRRRETGTREIAIDEVSVDAERRLVVLRGHSSITAGDVTVGIRITNAMGLEIYGTNTRLLNTHIAVQPGEDIMVTFAMQQMPLGPEPYWVTAAIHAGHDHLVKCYHWIDDAVAFTSQSGGAAAFSGMIDLNATAQVHVQPTHPAATR
jgi:hypothetical protein